MHIDKGNRVVLLSEAVKEIFGIWEDREFDVESYIRNLRENRKVLIISDFPLSQ